jgi:hypothetical protein
VSARMAGHHHAGDDGSYSIVEMTIKMLSDAEDVKLDG